MNAEQAVEAARAWIAADPDPETRRELLGHLQAGDTAQLIEVMSGELQFGTAGLRALVGAGPLRMNRAVVRRTTAGLARYLAARRSVGDPAPIVVGADARRSSAAFLAETVGVLAAHGLPVRYFEAPVATPIAAYAARRLGAAACVVITASHNPAEYNGYKLYGADAVQIVPPVDREIAEEIARSAPANAEPVRLDALQGGVAGVSSVPTALVEDYYRDVAALRPAGSLARDLRIAYTPLHGLGAPCIARVLGLAGFTSLHMVEEQREPDGRFPTVLFPNPEEPGALDLVVRLAQRVQAELVIANDPDVDRLAAAVPTGNGQYAPLTGNQIGLLLSDHALERYALQPGADKPQALVTQSIVSSPMLRAIAAAHGARCEQTLTGFKWIWTAALELMRSGQLSHVIGFEEALGYSVGQLVRDKDGISAALLLCELAASEKARGGSLRARLERLYRRHGLWVSVQRSVTRPGLDGAREIREAMDRISGQPPTEVLGTQVTALRDFRSGGETRPRWLGNTSLVELALGERGRILIRPSGTEPKLKIYIDLSRTLTAGADVWRAEGELQEEARSYAEAVVNELGFG
jgi:phosphomannomutase